MLCKTMRECFGHLKYNKGITEACKFLLRVALDDPDWFLALKPEAVSSEDWDFTAAYSYICDEIRREQNEQRTLHSDGDS